MNRTRDLNGEWLVVGDEVQIMPHRTATVLRIYREQGSREARIEVSNRMYYLWIANKVAKVRTL